MHLESQGCGVTILGLTPTSVCVFSPGGTSFLAVQTCTCGFGEFCSLQDGSKGNSGTPFVHC